MAEGLPPDPWELTPEEIHERIRDKPEPLRGMLEAMWRRAPRTKLNVAALLDMPNAGALYAAIQVLTEDELRPALASILADLYELRLSPEEFERWQVPPELKPDAEN